MDPFIMISLFSQSHTLHSIHRWNSGISKSIQSPEMTQYWSFIFKSLPKKHTASIDFCALNGSFSPEISNSQTQYLLFGLSVQVLLSENFWQSLGLYSRSRSQWNWGMKWPKRTLRGRAPDPTPHTGTTWQPNSSSSGPRYISFGREAEWPCPRTVFEEEKAPSGKAMMLRPML